MNEKDLRKYSRVELLELLIQQTKETERLQLLLDAANEELSQRKLAAQEAGTFAEASLRLNGVFEAAEAAAADYLENIRRQNQAMEAKIARREQLLASKTRQILEATEAQCKQMEEDTLRRCEEMKRIAKEEAGKYWKRASTRTDPQ